AGAGPGRGAGRISRAAGNGRRALVSVQFNPDDSPPVMTGADVMTSSGALGREAHPARRSAAPTRIATSLNTRPLCEWANRTQAVSAFTMCELRLTRIAPLGA